MTFTTQSPYHRVFWNSFGRFALGRGSHGTAPVIQTNSAGDNVSIIDPATNR